MSRAVSEIQADLTSAYTARRKALEGGEEYTLDDGQGKQSVKRSLASINKTIELLEAELADADGSRPESFSVVVDRGPIG